MKKPPKNRIAISEKREVTPLFFLAIDGLLCVIRMKISRKGGKANTKRPPKPLIFLDHWIKVLFETGTNAG